MPKQKLHPSEKRRNLRERKFPPCPFCGEIPKYPAHKTYCDKNPDAAANRAKVASKAKQDYIENGIEEKVKKGNVLKRDKLVENGRKQSVNLTARGMAKGPRSKASKDKIAAARVAIEAKKREMKKVRIEIGAVDVDVASIFSDPFFGRHEKIEEKNQEGWVIVDEWGIDDQFG